ncbi:MAG TPA: winged helix-turn-helix domain-containing protein, partial [Actinomycetota bacterium]|nr:winged helix-turn-helix domain-containing protein [Actinomycetota bacterium]
MAKQSWRGRPLVLEIARHTLILEGRRTDLPIKEFELLAALAARPGEAVTAKGLIDKVWPESSVMTSHDLYWYVWSLRKLIGDNSRESKLIANRRSFGYFLDLRPEQVEILEHGYATLDDSPDEPEESVPSAQDRAITPIPAGRSTAAANQTLMATRPRRRLAAAGLVAGVSATIVLSWLAGSWLSHRGTTELSEVPKVAGTPSTASPNQSNPRADNKSKTRPDRRGRDGKRHRPGNRDEGGGAIEVAGVGVPLGFSGESSTPPTTSGDGGGSGNGSSSGDGPQNPNPDSPDKPSSGGKNNPRDDEPEEVAPQPSITLYHLYHPDTEDHYATISSSTASQKQAAGYQASDEGRVFTSREAGTVAISLSDGTAYIYKDS